MFTQQSDGMRILHDVVHQAELQERRVRRALGELIAFSFLAAFILLIDYKMALVMFTYLDPTLDDTSLGPAILALSVPVAVVTIHLLVSDAGGRAIEKRLHGLAGVGVFVFLLGMAAMVALVFFDATDGIGSQGPGFIQGTVGDQDLDPGVAEQSGFVSGFGGVLSSLSPAVFFTGMTLLLFVTVYACHRLLVLIEERFDVVVNNSPRAKELQALYGEAEEIAVEIKQGETKHENARKRLPRDPEHKFAQVASAAITDALHRMKKALRVLEGGDDLGMLGLPRKDNIPAGMTAKEGRKAVSEIRHATTPYAILKELDGLPPKEGE